MSLNNAARRKSGVLGLLPSPSLRMASQSGSSLGRRSMNLNLNISTSTVSTRYQRTSLRRRSTRHPRIMSTVGVEGAAHKPPTKVDTTYDRHPYLLYFTTPATEQRYYDFQYVDNRFIPGKLFAFVWGLLVVASFVIFTGPFDDDGKYMVESFSSPWWYGVYASAVIVVLLSVGLFVDRLNSYREHIHLAQVFFGWPAIIFVTLILKRPYAFNYAFLFGCTGFSMLIVLPRLSRSLPFITLWPLICLCAITFSVSDYWDTHTKIEMMYWAILMTLVGLLAYLEKRVRQSFVDREKGMAAIAEIEHKTVVTQRMIANFFPATPTRDLLQQVNGPRDKAYPETVLIVTDIAGFTAHTAVSDPPDVIAMLTDMFHSFDVKSTDYHVEKIATVGDSYCGAVFPNDTTSSAMRCTNAIRFACSALPFAGYGLQLRVGVHIGDVVGVFVGCAPPKFDLFGPGIDHGRVMEERGRPGFVHISAAAMECVSVTTPASEIEPTPLGVLCKSWGADFMAGDIELYNDIRSYSDDEEEEKEGNAPLKYTLVVETLCGLSNVLRRESSVGVSLAVTPKAGDVKSLTSMVNTLNESALSEAEGVDEEDDDPYYFHPILLTFKKESIERRFKLSIQHSGVNEFCSRVFIVIAFGLFIVQLNLQCRTEQDMGVASSTLSLLAIMGSYILFVGVHHKFHLLVTLAVYHCIMVVGMLGLTAECGGLSLRARYVSDLGGTMAVLAIYAPQCCLDLKLIVRAVLTVITVCIGAICMAIRQNTVGDNVTPIDPLPLCGLAFVIMSFFPENSLRSAFQAEAQLRKLRRVAKSKGTAMATSALSIMLPTFVTDQILNIVQDEAAVATEGRAAPHASTTTTSSSLLASEDEEKNDVSDLDFNQIAATWDYNFAVLMFVKFHSDDPEFTPSVVNATVQAIERIMVRFDVMKVKTIGSTVMLVAGIDDPRTRQEQLTGVVDAAIMIRACVFPQMNVGGLVYRIGVHCGPCFGAVIGGNGAVFDLFGDTVNTSSRMMSTAKPSSIHLSSTANALLLPRLRDSINAQGAVNVKGKGRMEVFGVRDDVGLDQLPAFVGREFADSFHGDHSVNSNLPASPLGMSAVGLSQVQSNTMIGNSTTLTGRVDSGVGFERSASNEVIVLATSVDASEEACT